MKAIEFMIEIRNPSRCGPCRLSFWSVQAESEGTKTWCLTVLWFAFIFKVFK